MEMLILGGRGSSRDGKKIYSILLQKVLKIKALMLRDGRYVGEGHVAAE